MTYLYTFFGITAWASVVALSSHTLISYENTKQLESAHTFVITTQQGLGNKVTPMQVQESVPNTSAEKLPAKSIPQNTTLQTMSNPTSVKKNTNNRYYDNEDEEDEDD